MSRGEGLAGLVVYAIWAAWLPVVLVVVADGQVRVAAVLILCLEASWFGGLFVANSRRFEDVAGPTQSAGDAPPASPARLTLLDRAFGPEPDRVGGPAAPGASDTHQYPPLLTSESGGGEHGRRPPPRAERP